ncbi:MAG TPA: hypothetical protein VLH81_09930 [Desulfobacterales bacterium]|nr:hypothetical protein [Desulfobacterales bacterium]
METPVSAEARPASAPPDMRRLARFFAPLAVQAASQSICYPLVAMVASRGPGGPLDLAGLAQSNTVLFFLGIFAISLVPTGMVFARTREGYRRFYRITMAAGVCACLVQAALCVPEVSHLMFGRLIGLPPSIELPAQSTLLASIPLQMLFFSRIPYFVVMYIGQAAGMASLATIGRVALTAALSPLFCLLGWVGPLWAVVALTVPVALEAIASWHFMRPFREQLPSTGAPPPGLSDIFRFSVPLTVGGYFLSLSTVILAAFIARAPEPERMLPVYYLALGLASPAAFAATRLQTVVLAFPPADRHRGRTLRFAVAAGLVLGVLPLAFTLPGLAELYYVSLQNLDPADLGLVRWTAATLVFFPLATALRGQSEGLSAWLKRPSAVLFGHSMFLVAILLVGLATLALGAPGCFIGALSLPVGSLVSSATMRLALHGKAASAAGAIV